MKFSAKPIGIFTILVSIGMVAAILLLWLVVAGEVRGRKVDIEYEAFRISTSVQESIRLDSSYRHENPSIIGYGLYDMNGRAIHRDGTAPLIVDLSALRPNLARSGEAAGRDSIILFRPLGAQNTRGMGMGMGPGMGRGRTGQPANGAQGSALPLPSPMEPHFMWLEYSKSRLDHELALIFAAAIFVTMLLCGLCVATLKLYAHTEVLRLKELDNRELVQLGEAARTLVHEIKNPLGIIRIQAATLKKTGIDRVASSALVIEDEVMRLADLADRIRDFLKSGDGDAMSLEIGVWLEAYAARYSLAEMGREGPGLALKGGAVRGLVRIDPARLTQALDNLVSNAFDAMQGMEVPAPDLLVEKRGGMLELTVADRGPGIPTADRDRVFEPFFTTKEKGSGIGLALARKIARSAGGDLVYADRQGGGACFTLTLPLHPKD